MLFLLILRRGPAIVVAVMTSPMLVYSLLYFAVGPKMTVFSALVAHDAVASGMLASRC